MLEILGFDLENVQMKRMIKGEENRKFSGSPLSIVRHQKVTSLFAEECLHFLESLVPQSYSQIKQSLGLTVSS